MPYAAGEVILKAYVMDGHDAPNRCETCDKALPTEDDRRKHMKKTNHHKCPLCDEYVPIGGYYGHCCAKHGHERWNDHQVSWQDKMDLEEAQPWVTESRL